MGDVDSDEDVYEVERIIDNVFVGGKMYYLVRWKNYGKEGDTWEPRENLLSCEDLLNNYTRTQSEKNSGLSLPGDVFTANNSESDQEKDEMSENERKELKIREMKIAEIKSEKLKKKTQQIKQKKPKPQKVVESSTSSSSDSEVPSLKDDFWEKLKEGKIDVFATDLYSKVKARRPPEKEADVLHRLPPEITGKAKKRGRKKKPEKSEEDNRPVKTDENVEKQQEQKKVVTEKQKESKDDAVSRKKEKKKEKSNKTETEQSLLSKDNDVSEGTSSHAVLQYLEGEMKSKSHKKEGKSGKKHKKQKETTPPNLQDEIRKEPSGNQGKIQNISKPNIILEKLSIPSDYASVQMDVDVNDTRESVVESKPEQLGENEATDQDQKYVKKTPLSSEPPITKSSSKQNAPPSDDRPADSSKSCGVFEVMDAFSAHLQQSDVAISERMMQKKVKAKKSKTNIKITSPVPEKSTSVLEMLTEEMENTPTAEPTIKPAAKDNVKEKVGAQDPEINQEGLSEMSEFLNIHVTFKLDEISLKEIEQHHELGEPPCRLDKDITNAEFRKHIRSNNFEIIHEALKSKKMMYNLEHTDSVWMTQLMVAATAGYSEIVKILSHHGAKVNARTKNGHTALMFAAEKGHDIVCRILIAYGAYINLQTTSGDTALMKAAKNGHTMIVRYLLQAGADPVIKSVHGIAALELAERNAHSLLSGLIKDHETNVIVHVNECIQRECRSLGVKTIGLPVLAPRSYNIRECPSIHVSFNCVLQNLPPNQGLLLFAVHGMIMSGLSVKCRMRGPCLVMAVTMNNFVMEPLMPGKTSSEENTHYMTNLIWKFGQNSLKLFMAQDPLSSEKVFVTIFQCGLVA